MELPGMVIDEQVLGLLADPPVPTLTGHLNAQLCETVDALVRVQRGVQVALWRELDEMVTRQGSRRAVDISGRVVGACAAQPTRGLRRRGWRRRGVVVRPRMSIHIPIELLFGDVPTHAEICEMILAGRIEEVLELTGRGWVSRMGSVSLAAAKRLACDCELTMIGADIHGAPLTVVTDQRYATKKHRIALEGRDRGCSFPSCDRPVDWTEAHHMISWETRHETQVDGLCLLCKAHHVAVHHQGWEVALSATRFPVFRPPARIDPFRRWRDGNGNVTGDPPPPEVFFADTA